jgi:hypothetical protein
MKTFISLGLTASLATLSIAGTTFHDLIGDLKIKRGFLTCQETYGDGSTTCGGSNSHYCYDPTLGEVRFLLNSLHNYDSDKVFRAAASWTTATVS